MIVRPEIEALKADPDGARAGQATVCAALERWRSGTGADSLDAELAAFARGKTLDRLPSLGGLFASGSCATGWVRGLCAELCAALAGAPLAQVPLRHSLDSDLALLVLAHCPGATLAVRAVSPRETRPLPERVSFSPQETWDAVLSGAAEAELIGRSDHGGPLQRKPLMLSAGWRGRRDGRRETLVLRRVMQPLVTLRLQRTLHGAGPSQSVDLASGRVIALAASDPRDSRTELAAALLGRMGRSDAAPALARLALGEGSEATRWQVLRECLALDAAAGFAALAEIAGRADDPLQRPAAELKAQLVAAHPVLQALEPCPA